MKHCIISSDAAGNINPMISQGLLDYLPDRVASQAQADAVVIPIAYAGGYRFNPELLRITKPIIIFDFLEMGWDAGDRENRLGRGALQQFGHLESDEWAKLDSWVAEHPPALTFKRELLERNRSKTMLPIEWPCRIPAPPLQSRAEFNARPFEVFNCFGYSHPSRPRLHGQIFEAMGSKGVNVISDWSQFSGMPKPVPPKTFVSIYSPYWCRQPIERVMEIQQQAKISVSLFGAGRKSFRDSEAPVGAVMARPIDGLSWSFPWTQENSIRLLGGYEFEGLHAATERDDLFELYRADADNLDRYRSARYVTEYVTPAIEQLL